MEDAQLALMVLYRAGLWHKGMNADLVDSKHAAYLTTAVNGTTLTTRLERQQPAAPSGGLNVKWQVATAQNTDSQTPVSAYVPFSSISTVTAVSTDYVVITDTSDSNNPKRALVSDIATATLSGIGSGTPVAADTFVFIDADDGVAKKGSAADTLVALGGAPSATAVTATKRVRGFDKYLIRSTGAADRSVDDSGVTLDDSNNMAGIGTLASGAHTITQATVGTVFRTEVSTATNDDPTEKFYHGRATTTEDGGAALFNLTPATDKRYTIEATVLVRQTTGAGAGTGRTIKVIADIENISGTVTVTIVSNTSGGTLAVNSCTVTVSFGVVSLTCQVEGIVGSGKYVHHAKIALFGPVGT